MNTQTLSLDLSKRPTGIQVVNIRQGDDLGTILAAEIYDNGVAATLTGLTAAFCMRLPHDEAYIVDSNCTISGNVVTYEIDESRCASVVGKTSEAYFRLYSGNEHVYSTGSFTVMVLKDASSGVDPAHIWSNGVEEWLEEAGVRLEQAVTDASNRVDNYMASLTTSIWAIEDEVRGDISRMETTAVQALSEIQGQRDRVEAAINAVGDISEQAVPLMSADTRGGAKLGAGLALDDGALRIGTLAPAGNGTGAGPIAKATGEGHAEQATTIGKNLLPPITSTTKSGITATRQADGSLMLNGTATAAASYAFPAITLPAGTYKLSGAYGNPDFYKTGTMSSNNRLYASAGGTNYFDNGNAFTLSEQTQVTVYLVIVSGSVLSNSVIYPQLEAGTTATAYEPYTGGAPSPSPDHPQEIQVVRGRNLIDASAVTNLYPSGSAIASSSSARSFVAKVSRNTTYTVSAATANRTHVYGTGSTMPALDVACTAISTGASYSGPVTFDSGANDWVIIQLAWNGTVADPQLELGETATPYVPYGHIGIDAQRMDVTKVVLDGSETWTVSGSASNRIYMTELDSAYHDGTARSIVWIDGYTTTTAGHSNMADRSVKLDSGASRMFVKDTRYTSVSALQAALAESPLTAYYVNDSHMGEFPTLPMDAIPIPLPARGWVASLPNGTADALAVDGAGHVVWTLPTSEVVLDGTNAGWNVSKATTTNLNRFFCIGPSGTFATNDSANLVYCSHFAGSSKAGNGEVIGRCYVNSATQFAVNYSAYDSTTADDFKTWLASNPLTVLYPLATPTTEDMGYVDMPEIPVGSTVTIPELQNVSIAAFIDASVTQYAREWSAREDAKLSALRASVAPVEGRVATANHAVGTYVMLADQLCKVTSAIATGETIAIGTNVTTTTVMAEVLSLTS